MKIPINPSNAPACGTSPQCVDEVVDAAAATLGGPASGGNSRNACGASFGIHPTPASSKVRFCGTGAGGSRCLSGFVRMVNPHHAISRTIIAVVMYIIFNASSDDS